MDLFARREQQLTALHAPLAARMRPRTLGDYVGQEHILGPGRLLRRAIEADRLSSLIFHGPPGTGKTTLAQVIAQHTRAQLVAVNAVLAGVKELREAIEGARERLRAQGRQTILFVDEVHRFNKAQQDALLPWVEQGTLILIGATTENPLFEVNKALISRSRLFALQPLTSDHLRVILYNALSDPERGYGQRLVRLDPDAREHLIDVAQGDARTLLNALELAVETTPVTPGPSHSPLIHITLQVAQESIQRRAVLYDKEGDAHFDIISAFIKSLRGSDPDAALYWLARMIYAGEDPRFILRRLLIFASEDVGLADPQAVGVVEACAASFDRVGSPEGRYPLAQATLYLATAKKSNSTMGFFDALACVERERASDIPSHLKDPSRDAERCGHGKGYLYPHAYREHWVAQQYLPASLQGRSFYTPSRQGYEALLHDEVTARRDAQLAAMLERQALGLDPHPERLTSSPAQPSRWLERTVAQSAQALERLRDAIFAAAQLQRHHLVADLRAAQGLLTWEAVRRCPEGGVWAVCSTPEEALAMTQRAQSLPELDRPSCAQAASGGLRAALAALDAAHAPASFDVILARQALSAQERVGSLLPSDLHPLDRELEPQEPDLRQPERPLHLSAHDASSPDASSHDASSPHELAPRALQGQALLRALGARLAPGGRLILAELLQAHTPRLVELCLKRLSAHGDPPQELRPVDGLGAEHALEYDLDHDLIACWRQAEQTIYDPSRAALMRLSEASIASALEDAGFLHVQAQTLTLDAQRWVSAAQLDAWLRPGLSPDSPSYRDHLQAAGLDDPSLDRIERAMRAALTDQLVPWHATYALVCARGATAPRAQTSARVDAKRALTPSAASSAAASAPSSTASSAASSATRAR